MEIEKEVNLLYLKSYYKNWLKWFDLICRSERWCWSSLERDLWELGYITSKAKLKYVKEYVFFCGYYNNICLKLFCSNDQLAMVKEKDKRVKIYKWWCKE